MPLVLRANCVLVGDSAVGKSALTHSLSSDGTQFAKAYSMTTCVDVCVKALRLPQNGDVTVELYIHDSAGKDVFADQVQQFWGVPSVVMVVYDVSSEQSFASCGKWLERVRAKRTAADTPLPGVLVGNKADLPASRREVSSEQGQELATAKDLHYFECSAKTEENVDQPFLELAQQFHKLYEDRLETL